MIREIEGSSPFTQTADRVAEIAWGSHPLTQCEKIASELLFGDPLDLLEFYQDNLILAVKKANSFPIRGCLVPEVYFSKMDEFSSTKINEETFELQVRTEAISKFDSRRSPADSIVFRSTANKIGKPAQIRLEFCRWIVVDGERRRFHTNFVLGNQLTKYEFSQPASEDYRSEETDSGSKCDAEDYFLVNSILENITERLDFLADKRSDRLVD